jgi:hypothetical protein
MTRSPSVWEDGVVPGPQDQLYEHRQADHVRPLDRNPTIAELRERLERLPPNHPSSPRYDDGSRQSPEPELTTRELRAAGDADSGGELATISRDLPSEDAPRIHPDGSWEWKGYKLTPTESRCADLALARCRDAEGRDAEGNYGEHGLTPAMRRIEAQLEHAKLAPDTEKFALKSADRFKEKLAKMIAAEPDKSVEELASEIHDAVRYTFILDETRHVHHYRAAENILERRGFGLEVRRNMWAESEYKGINSRWRDPHSGLPFEIQFHTESSWLAKQETHPAYARIADLRTPADERKRLQDYQRAVSARVLELPRVMEIADYRKEASRND